MQSRPRGQGMYMYTGWEGVRSEGMGTIGRGYDHREGGGVTYDRDEGGCKYTRNSGSCSHFH